LFPIKMERYNVSCAGIDNEDRLNRSASLSEFSERNAGNSL